MKTNTLKAAAAFGLSALLMGSAAAQSTSQPVGYETITIDSPYTYMGLRLVGAPVATTTVATVDTGAGTLTVDASVEDGTYIFEVNPGSDAAGAVQTATVAGGVATITGTDIADENLIVGDSVTFRTPQTLASVFGDPINGGFGGAATPDQGLTGAFTRSAADLILVPNEDGTAFATYWYFDGGFGGPAAATWRVVDADTGVESDIADPSAIGFFYTDGVIIQNRDTDNSIVVSGSVKTTPTVQKLTGQYTYLSTIYPAGVSLATLFNTREDTPEALPSDTLAPGTLEQAFTFSAADLVLVPTASGFDTYWHFDGGFGGPAAATWRKVDGDTGVETDIDADTVSFEDVTGIIIQNRGDLPQDVNFGVASFYDGFTNDL